MIEKSTYFYSDEESHDPICALSLIVQLIIKSCRCGIRVLSFTPTPHPFAGAQMFIVLQKFTMKCKYRTTNGY